MAGCERDSYFKKSLSLLEDSSSDSEKFLLQCRVEQEKYDEFWPASSLTPCYNYYNKEFEVHDYSTSILPKELQNSYSALKCSADGNCLYRSVSILCNGDEELHYELRARVACELTLHKQYYLKDDITSVIDSHGRVIMKNVLMGTSSQFYSTETVSGSDCKLEAVFDAECRETARISSFSSMWHVQGLSTVISTPIMSVYPQYNKRLHPVYNKLIYPRCTSTSEHSSISTNATIAIMWSRTAPPPNLDWNPNHFVPLVKIDHMSRHMPVQEPYTDIIFTTSYTKPIDNSTISLSSKDNTFINSTTKKSVPVQPTLSSILAVSNTAKQSTIACTHASKGNTLDSYVYSSSHCRKRSLQDRDNSHAQKQRQKIAANEPSLSTIVLTARPKNQYTITNIAHRGKPKPRQENPIHMQDGITNIDNNTGNVMLEDSDSSHVIATSVHVGDSLQGTPDFNKIIVDDDNSDSGSMHTCNKVGNNLSSNSLEISDTISHSSEGKPWSIELVDDESSDIGTAHSSSDEGKSWFIDPVDENSDSDTAKNSIATSDTPCSNLQCTLSPGNSDSITYDRTGNNLHVVATSDTISLSHCEIVDNEDSGPGSAYKRLLIGNNPVVTSDHTISSSDNNVVETIVNCGTTMTLQAQEGSSNSSLESIFNMHDIDTLNSMEEMLTVQSPSNSFGLLNVPQNSPSLYPHDYLEKEMSTSPVTEECTIVSDLSFNSSIYTVILPYKWYEKQNRLMLANNARDSLRSAMPIESTSQKMMLLNRSVCSGRVEENLKYIEAQLDMSIKLKQESQISHWRAIYAVGMHLVKEGPLVSTRELIDVYSQHKEINACAMPAATFYETLCKHLNIVQIYINGKGYIIENQGNALKFLKTVESEVNTHKIVNDQLKSKLEDIYSSALAYLDTPRDRLVLKGIIAKVTSIKFAAALQGVGSRQGARSALNKLKPNLDKYEEIRATSQIVRNDMTCKQQYTLTNRIIFARKIKQIKVIASGRGRKLKVHEYPELPSVLEYAFGEKGPTEDSIGLLESHPRLTTTTLYRTRESATTMIDARELLLSLAPHAGFTISLSSCYNYTQNFRKGTRQALRHHEGVGVNANVSLKPPSRTAVEHQVVNLHWSSSNVVSIIDSFRDDNSAVVISKDAKAIIPGDIPPVQHQGRSWSKRSDLDHTWDQGRAKSVTPMTFLFLKTKITSGLSEISIPLGNVATVQLTRSGQPVTLLYLSFYEPDTTMKCLNEILYLLTLDGLDLFFRDPDTGCLKNKFIFVVDNGPAEQPSSPMVQMCLVRLLLCLKLEKIVQVSFAEYHSKRNYVERVHAEENRVLSQHGPFKSNLVHKSAQIGTTEHRENMEKMASEVNACLNCATFGGNSLQCYRGIKQEDYFFTDEDTLHHFLSLSEEKKDQFTNSYSFNITSSFLNKLCCTWGIGDRYCGSYHFDYQMLNNTATSDTTCWRDKYTIAVYSPTINITLPRYELQPLPDYIRWSKTGELHYLPLNERQKLPNGLWDSIPGAFMPSKILELFHMLIPKPSDAILHQIALLAWVSPAECRESYSKHDQLVSDMCSNDRSKEAWKEHPLYKSTKSALESMCRSAKIPVTASMTKHELVRLISSHKKETPPDIPPLYSGELVAVPTSSTALSRLSVGVLRAILRWHNLPILGNKDQLVLRVILLRHQETAKIFAQEEQKVKDMMDLADTVVQAERVMNVSLRSHTYNVRKYSSNTTEKYKDSLLEVPHDIQAAENWSELFNPLRTFLDEQKQERLEQDRGSCSFLYTKD